MVDDLDELERLRKESDARRRGIHSPQAATTQSMLIRCADCGATVSRRASECPKCGAPFTKPTTGFRVGLRWVTLLIAVAIFLFGCASADVAGASNPLAERVISGVIWSGMFWVLFGLTFVRRVA